MVYSVILMAVWFVVSVTSLVRAEHDLPERLRHDAQVQSNNGKYEEARQLRAIAEALKNKDASTAQQVQTEIGKGNVDKAMNLLKIR